MDPLARLLAPYQSGGNVSSLQDLAQDPIYGLILNPPQTVRPNNAGTGGINTGAGLEPLLQKLTHRLPWLDITSGFRTEAEQAALYKQKPDLAAPPGHSFHEVGGALDVNQEDIGRLLSWLNKHPRFGNAIYRPMDYEPWHFQLRGERSDYL